MLKIAKTVANYIKTHKYVLVALYWPFHTVWYELLRAGMDRDTMVLMHSPLDDQIPFIEWFGIPYSVWFVYIAAVIIGSLVTSKRDFLRSHTLVFLCMMLPMVFCTAVPNGISEAMRPDFATLGRENLGTLIVQFIYSTDSPPTSVMPSMHCAVSVVLVFAVLQLSSLKGKPVPKICATVLSVLIILATVFIKQHSILDLIAGTSFGLVMGFAVLIAEKLYDRRKKKKAATAAE